MSRSRAEFVVQK